MDGFTLISGLLGGMMIGVAATLMLLLNGRISGISGIVGGLVSPGARKGGEAAPRVAFVAGLVLGPLGYAAAVGGLPVGIEASLPVLVIAGLLVGFGTRLGSGWLHQRPRRLRHSAPVPALDRRDGGLYGRGRPDGVRLPSPGLREVPA